MRSSLGLLLLLPLGCASEPFDELAGDTGDASLDTKADASINSTFGYYEITPDLRKCAFPMCGGYFFSALNRSDDARYAPQLDWTEANLSVGMQGQLLAQAQRGTTSNGVYAIVRGRFAPARTGTPVPEFDRFVITEAWVAVGDTVADGVFVTVKDNGIRCIVAPCPNLTERALNSWRWANIAEIDYTLAKLDDKQIAGLQDQLFTPTGIMIAGTRYTVDIGGRTAKGRTATAAYTRLVNPTCFVGGCNHEICGGDAGAVSDCIWRPEFACYRTATCEVQTDGACGWTHTPELDACLAAPMQ